MTDTNEPAAEPVKKGRPTWKPAKKLELHAKVDGFRYRWVNREDPKNLERKLAEGWAFANKATGLAAEHVRPAGDEKPLDTTDTYRELTLMALPEELAVARDEYIEAETQKQTVGRAQRLQKDVAAETPKGVRPAAVHQRITIE